MARFKFFGFILPLAIAGGLALGLAAAPAMADKPDPVTHMHDHSGENGDEPGTRIEVELECDLDFGPCAQFPATTCLGTTVQMRLDTLSADFAQGCTISMTIDDPAIEDRDLSLSLFRVGVRTKGSGVTDITLYFTTNSDFRIGDIAETYRTDRVPVDLGEDGSGNAVLTPVVRPVGALTKELQPGKGAVTNENVSYRSITYTPVMVP